LEVYSHEEVDILIATLDNEPTNWKMMIILAANVYYCLRQLGLEPKIAPMLGAPKIPKSHDYCGTWVFFSKK
jgi:hypothetical protein